MKKTFTVYKYVDTRNDEIVYVGITDREMTLRINEHKIEHKFLPYLDHTKIYYFTVPNPAVMNAMETFLIDRYTPVLNDSKKYDDTMKLDFSEPEWLSFDQYKKPILKNNKPKQNHNNIRRKRGKINYHEENRKTIELINYIISKLTEQPDIREIAIPKHLENEYNYVLWYYDSKMHGGWTIPFSIYTENNTKYMEIPKSFHNPVQYLKDMLYDDSHYLY